MTKISMAQQFMNTLSPTADPITSTILEVLFASCSKKHCVLLGLFILFYTILHSSGLPGHNSFSFPGLHRASNRALLKHFAGMQT